MEVDIGRCIFDNGYQESRRELARARFEGISDRKKALGRLLSDTEGRLWLRV